MLDARAARSPYNCDRSRRRDTVTHLVIQSPSGQCRRPFFFDDVHGHNCAGMLQYCVLCV